MSLLTKDRQIASQFMIATEYATAPCVPFPQIITEKLNGLRARYFPGRGWYSRDGILWSADVLAHIETPLLRTGKEAFNAAPVDCELYCPDMSLQEINSAVGIARYKPGPGFEKVKAYVFDLALDMIARDRLKVMQHVIGENIEIVPYTIVNNRAEADAVFETIRAQGKEGIIYRALMSPYCGGPSRNLLKRKAWLDGEFPVVGAVEGEKDCKGVLGALVCLHPNGQRFNVGSGYTREQRVEWLLSPPAKIKVQYITLSDAGVPQNPSFMCVEVP